MRALHAKRQQTSQAGENPLNANKRAVYHSLESGTGHEGPPLISFTILRVHPSVQL